MVVCICIACVICGPVCCCGASVKDISCKEYLNYHNNSPKKMNLIVGAGKQIVWIFSRVIFLLLRSIAWIVLLRYFKIIANYRESAYKRTVHVQRILARHKLDAMIQPASANNFLTMHKCFVDPEYVLLKNVTLYCTTKRAAYFVECDPSVDVTSSDVSSFFKIAQFNNAINLIAVPMHVFHKLGTVVGKPNGQLVILTNTTRCGSTLLSQVFEETHECVSISEPDAANTLSTLSTKLPPEEMDRLVRNTVHMLCKNSDSSTKACVIKLSQNNTLLVPYFCRVFPDVKTLFMYRNGLAVSRSIAKVMRGLPMTGILSVLARNFTCMKMAKGICHLANVPIHDFKDFGVVMSHMQVGSICWASAMRGYLNFLELGIDIAAVKYEDMVGDTTFALGQIFEHCGMEYNEQAVITAFSRDSQRGSPISRERLGKFDHDEITDEIKEQTDDACRLFNVPSIYDTYIAENTITHRALADDANNPTNGMRTRESSDSLLLSPQDGTAVITIGDAGPDDIALYIPNANSLDSQEPHNSTPEAHSVPANSLQNPDNINSHQLSDTQDLVPTSTMNSYGACSPRPENHPLQSKDQYIRRTGHVNLSFEEESPISASDNDDANLNGLSVVVERNNQVEYFNDLHSNFVDMQVITI